MTREPGTSRRALLKTAVFVPFMTSGVVGAPLFQEQEEEVSTVEDLMREHGVLRRVLLIYGEAIRRIDRQADVPADVVGNAAGLVRRFVEDYHE